MRADAFEAKRLIAAARADVVGGDAEQHALEAHVLEVVVQEGPERLGTVALTEVGRVQIDAEHGRALFGPHVAQEDAADHLARLIFDGERNLMLAAGDVFEPARALPERHASRAGADE